jgi:hypothetical protein
MRDDSRPGDFMSSHEVRKKLIRLKYPVGIAMMSIIKSDIQRSGWRGAREPGEA